MPVARTTPRFRTRVVRAGVYYGIVVLVIGLAAGSRPNNLLVWIFSALIAAFLASGIVSGFSLLRVRAIRIEPGRGRVGEPLLVRYEVVNTARILPVYDLHVEETQAKPGAGGSAFEKVGGAWLMHVGPRERFHGEAVYRPLRRGAARLGEFTVSTTFPFGLMRKCLHFSQPAEVLVHPEIRPLRAEVLAQIASGGVGGQRLSGKPGGSDDFFGVRDYRPGDSIRSIAWKRLAGTGQLATIERSRAVPPRLRVLLDLRAETSALRVAEGEDARALEERAIVLAASFVALADRLGYEYALSVAGVDVPPVALRRGHFHREKIMSLLASIDLDRARTAGNGLSASDERATIVVVHPDRADTEVAPEAAWHFVARQLDGLVERASGGGAAP
ncbi:MAG: DUF58 domain-containing protein [Planctomycetota bacterium]